MEAALPVFKHCTVILHCLSNAAKLLSGYNEIYLNDKKAVEFWILQSCHRLLYSCLSFSSIVYITITSNMDNQKLRGLQDYTRWWLISSRYSVIFRVILSHKFQWTLAIGWCIIGLSLWRFGRKRNITF